MVIISILPNHELSDSFAASNIFAELVDHNITERSLGKLPKV
jgi:hypothetical protein